jgi:hypothetical protein
MLKASWACLRLTSWVFKLMVFGLTAGCICLGMSISELYNRNLFQDQTCFSM